MDILRWVTVHPILVHATLGGIPLMLLAYAVAAQRRSSHWLFAGDFVLFATAIATIGTGVFGFVSFFVIDWPGGLDLWRWLHLGLGVTTAAILWVMAGLRAWSWKKHDIPNIRGLVAGAAAAFVFAVFAGWVGGEVLVYRSGVGVIGAQNGALSPPVPQIRIEPRDMADAMGRIRGHFVAISGEQLDMIVQRPTPQRFHLIEVQAHALQDVTRWLMATAEDLEAQHQHSHQHDHHQGNAVRDRSMLTLASELETAAAEIEHAAREQDLGKIAHAVEAAQTTCVACHLEHRWGTEELRAER